jgi:hypothetical protein
MIPSLVKAFLLFVLVGPLIGLGCIVLQDSASFGAVLPPILVLMAFALGVIPAAATGLTAWALRHKLSRYSGGVVCGLTGALASALYLAPQGSLNMESVVRLGLAPGAVAGFICGLLYFWRPNSQARRGAA